MRKAIHQTSQRHPSREDADDALEGTVRGLKTDLGIEAAWVCAENRVHLIVTKVADLETLKEDQLKPGQRLVWLPEITAAAA